MQNKQDIEQQGAPYKADTAEAPEVKYTNDEKFEKLGNEELKNNDLFSPSKDNS